MESIKESLLTGFTYLIEVMDKQTGKVDESQTEIVHNLTPIEGLNYFLSAGIKGAAQLSTWYIGIFEGNYTPQTTDIMSTFPGSATESTAYAESARLAFSSGAVSAGALDNSAAVANFTINATKTIYGGFISSGSVKGNGSGVLLSAVRFTSPKAVDNSTILKVTAGFQMASV
jgi:hypothetical protein